MASSFRILNSEETLFNPHPKECSLHKKNKVAVCFAASLPQLNATTFKSHPARSATSIFDPVRAKTSPLKGRCTHEEVIMLTVAEEKITTSPLSSPLRGMQKTFREEYTAATERAKGKVELLEAYLVRPKELTSLMTDRFTQESDTLKNHLENLKKLNAHVHQEYEVVPGTPYSSNEGDVFLRFIALCERQYLQAQADANDLYREAKHRTDQVQLLSDIMAEANLTKEGDVNWTENPAMQKKLDYAIEHLGLKWDKGYRFDQTDKLILIENVRGVKEGIEKMDKLQQLKMQQFFHTTTETIQMMSNVAKSLHDILMDLARKFNTRS